MSCLAMHFFGGFLGGDPQNHGFQHTTCLVLGDLEVLYSCFRKKTYRYSRDTGWAATKNTGVERWCRCGHGILGDGAVDPGTVAGSMGTMSSVQRLCWLMIIGDYTTQYIGDHDNPTEDSL